MNSEAPSEHVHEKYFWERDRGSSVCKRKREDEPPDKRVYQRECSLCRKTLLLPDHRPWCLGLNSKRPLCHDCFAECRTSERVFDEWLFLDNDSGWNRSTIFKKVSRYTCAWSEEDLQPMWARYVIHEIRTTSKYLD